MKQNQYKNLNFSFFSLLIYLMKTIDEKIPSNSYVFPKIDEMDPCIPKGSKVLFDGTVPFEVRIGEINQRQNTQTIQNLRVRVMQSEYIFEGQTKISEIKIEITSEEDIFFYLKTVINHTIFNSIQGTQKLTINFHELAPLLVKILSLCIYDQQKFNK